MDIEAIPLLCVIAADFFPFSYHHVFPSTGISVHPTDIPAGAPGDRQQCPVRDRAQSVRRTLQRPLHYVWISFRRSSAGLWSVSTLLKRYINFQSIGKSLCSFLTHPELFMLRVKLKEINITGLLGRFVGTLNFQSAAVNSLNLWWNWVQSG